MATWFRRLADVPNLRYEGSSDVNRSRLLGHDAVPEVQIYDFNGERRESLMWPTREGSTSASPAKQWKTQIREDESPTEIALRQLIETLELPGILSDYHFAIQDCHETLWSTRRTEPWVLVEIEKLCWLDIRLIEAHPSTISFGTEDKQNYFGVSAFRRLIHLYEQEGYLHEALDVAKRAVRFHQGELALEHLQTRITQLESEDAN